jgi:hypothetical protein
MRTNEFAKFESVISYHFGRDDLLRTRFAITPVFELIGAFYALRNPRRYSVHRPWADWAAARPQTGAADLGRDLRKRARRKAPIAWRILPASYATAPSDRRRGVLAEGRWEACHRVSGRRRSRRSY